MPTYRIVIHGENCLVDLEGIPKTLGFLTTRMVKSDNPDKAGEIALASVTEALKGRVSNVIDNGPSIYVKDIYEASLWSYLLAKFRPIPGFIWYDGDER